MSTSQRLAPQGAFELINLALERHQTTFRNEFAMVTQAMIKLFLPTIDSVGFQVVSAAQLDYRRASLPLLKDGELLLGGNTVATAAFGGWIWVYLHKRIQAFQTVQISTGADQLNRYGTVVERNLIPLKNEIEIYHHFAEGDGSSDRVFRWCFNLNC